MEDNRNKKKNLTPYIIGFGILLLIFVLAIFISQGGLANPQGPLLAGLVVVMIVTGILQIRKSLKTPFVPPARTVVPAAAQPEVEVASATPSPSPAAATVTAVSAQPTFAGNVGAWLRKYPKNMQIGIVAGGAVGVVLILVLFIGLVSGSLFAASPTGTWIQQGYEDRVRYVFFEDGTFEYYDNDELSGTGYIVQTGNHVDLHYLTYYQYVYEDNYETAHYVIAGDRMTSGVVVLLRQTE